MKLSSKAVTIVVLLLVLALGGVSCARPHRGFHVRQGRLMDARGNDVVLRGINHPHAWYPTQTGSFASIEAAGANSVRVVLSGGRWAPTGIGEVANVISRCRQHRLVCVLENHDTTGYGEQAGAVTLSQAVDYWISIRSALIGQEAHVILNIGNEPFGNNPFGSWTSDSANAIRRLRAAGFAHTIMVDAPNWGQDWSFTMRDNASTVAAADPHGNTIFSVHMYGVFDTADEVRSYIDSFVSHGLPLVVGEFGHDHSDGDPDEDTIMSHTRTQAIGYLAWSWSGNGGDVTYLDLVNDFDANRRTPWGTRLIEGPDGLRATSREASILDEDTDEP